MLGRTQYLCDVVNHRSEFFGGSCSYYYYKLCLDDIVLFV